MNYSKAERARQIFERARSQRQKWENLWNECFTYTQPLNTTEFFSSNASSTKQNSTLYDSTAPDAVEQLAASLLAELTPPGHQWFTLEKAIELDDQSQTDIALEKISDELNSMVEKSNLAIELHQSFIDLTTIGTACILVEQTAVGSRSPLSFSAVPINEIYLHGSKNGAIKTIFRVFDMLRHDAIAKFPAAIELQRDNEQNASDVVKIIEMYELTDSGCSYCAFLQPEKNHFVCVDQGEFKSSPIVVFRWNKNPGELYGRSPIMTTLADIKTANKVVELILKNASISVTGIWLAEDDGILNPRNVRLVPGAIIPKAIGSKGLTPLEAPGRFDVSQLVLSDLREKIRKTMLVDKLGQPKNTKMTATEILERSIETTRILGATFSRLQSELIYPLLERIMSVFEQRGILPLNFINSGSLTLRYKSPLLRAGARSQLANTILWADTAKALGSEAIQFIDYYQTVRWIADTLDVPKSLHHAINDFGD